MRRLSKYILIIFLMTVSYLFAQDPYLGYWETPDHKIVIQIEKQGDEYVGYLRWLQDPRYPKGDPMAGQIQVDRNNPNPELRHRRVLNLQVVGDLKLNKDKTKLTGGWIYDAWHGRKYYGRAKVINENTLSLRGSLDPWGILGYSMKVKRVNLVDGNPVYVD
nr:DUF2147 domain-containing protein [uncultured Cetobacterium sp.]